MKNHLYTILILTVSFIANLKAGEFVLVNEIVTMDDDPPGFYFWYNMSNSPTNWLSPDDYYNGQFYFRFEVTEIPTDEVCYFSLDIWGDYDGASYYTETSSDISAPLSGVGGVSTYHSSPSTWYTNNGGVNFSDRTTFWRWGIVMWASKNPPVLLAPKNWSDDPRSWDYWAQKEKWLPMKIKVTIVAVSQGSTFSGWDNYLGDIADPPNFHIDYLNETTSEIIPSDIEYKINSGSWQSGTGQKVSVAPGNIYYFRPISSPYAASTQTLVAKSRPSAPSFQIDYINENTSTVVGSDYEYADNASMTSATQGNNVKIDLTPGTTKYFRKKATSNDFVSSVQTLAIPSKPAFPGAGFSIDYISEKTSQVVSNSFEYKLSGNASWTTGSGSVISLQPDKTYYFRAKATTISFSSTSQTLNTPGRSAIPSFGIDYQNESTDLVITTAYEYASNSAMTGAVSGTGQKINLVPGSEIYFRKKATVSSFKSLVQQLSVDARPATPNFMVDFQNERTAQNISGQYQYSDNADMSDAVSGSNTKITLVPGNVKYFQKSATVSSFASGIQIMNLPNRPQTPSFGIDYLNESTDISVSSAYEYAYNFGMTGAVIGTGLKVALEPGSEIYFRKKATTSAFKSLVQMLTVDARPAAPDFTIDFPNEKTTQAVTDLFEYSENADMSDAITGDNDNIILEPGSEIYFRKKATTSAFKSLVQMLTVEARPAVPDFTIDFPNEKTTQAVSDSFEYSVNADMSGAITGNNDKIDLGPGSEIYFRKKATASAFKSLVQTLSVDTRPKKPDFTIDYINEKTLKAVSSDYVYSTSEFMNNPDTGSGVSVDLTPGVNLYFRQLPTSSTFQSEAQELDVPGKPEAPVVSVDFTQEKTKETIPENMIYSGDKGFSGFEYGQGLPVSLIPGETMYFKVLPGDTTFGSEVFNLEIPDRPEIGNYSINFIEKNTNENVDTLVNYATMPDFQDAQQGTDDPVPVVPGKDLYFKIMPTEHSFVSEVFYLRIPEVPVLFLTNGDSAIHNPFQVSVLFDSTVAQFSLDELVLTNAHASNLHDSYTFDVYPESNGPVNIQLPAIGGEEGFFAAEELNLLYEGQVSIHDYAETEAFRIYPNPSSGLIQFEFPSDDERSMILLDLRGRIILRKVLLCRHELVDLSMLESGMYILRIADSKGATESRKLFLDL